MQVGFVQTDPVFGDREENYRQVSQLVEGVHADLLVLPELFATGYTFVSVEEVRSLAETPDGSTAEFLKSLAQKIRGHVVAGYPELASDDSVYNAAMLVSPDGIRGNYRKIHLFNREKLWFAPGDRAPEVFDIGQARVGLMICFDWIFPETARTLALAGADILAHPANLVLPYCQDAMITRCLENRVYSVTANRVGCERRGPDEFCFTGASQITGPDGTILLREKKIGTSVEVSEIDPTLARSKGLNPHNDLFGDRKTGLYDLVP